MTPKAPAGGRDVTGLVAVLESPTLLLLAGLVILLTLLIVAIEVRSKSKADMHACLNGGVLVYLIVLSVGNAAASVLSLVPFQTSLPGDRISVAYALIGSVLGVFGFEGIMSNTNVSMFNRRVLHISDWVKKARDSAVAATSRQATHLEDRLATSIAKRLSALPENQLNALVDDQLGAGRLTQFEAAARHRNLDPKLYKALKLTKSDPRRAAQILKAHSL